MRQNGPIARLRDFVCRCEGGVATVVAVMLPAILGIGAIAFDMGYWYLDRRSLQTAADAAAVTTAWALADGATTDEAIAAGKASAAVNGYSEADGDTVTIAVNATTRHATATISRDADLFLSSVILDPDDIDLGASAVAGAQNSDPVCLLALQGFDSGVTENGGSSDVDIWATNCSVQANSSDANALDTNGVNAWIVAKSVCANYSQPPTGNNIPNATPPAYACPPLLNPFPTQLAPEWDGTADNCPHHMAAAPSTTDGTTTIRHGCYVNDTIQESSNNLKFEAGGVFYLYNTDIKMTGGNKDTTGEGITIFLYGDSTIDLAGSRHMNLSAKPSTSYTFPNILIAADASSSGDLTGGQSGDSKLGGSSSSTIEGIIYLPRQDLRIGGTGDLVATEAMIVGNTVTVVGNGSLTITAPTFDSVKRSVVMLLQ